MAHVLMENRNSLVVAGQVTTPQPQAEWEAGLEMLAQVTQGRKGSVGGDKAYDEASFVAGGPERASKTHVEAYEGPGENIERRAARNTRYSLILNTRTTTDRRHWR